MPSDPAPNAQVAVPVVLPGERMLFSRAGLPGMYRAVLRYGYMDRVNLGPDFVGAVVHEACCTPQLS